LLTKTSKPLSALFSSDFKNVKAGDLFSYAGSHREVLHECYWADSGADPSPLPNLVVPNEGDLETFFADVATYYAAECPLTAQVHVVQKDQYLSLIKATNRDAGIAQSKLPALIGMIFGEVFASVGTEQADPAMTVYPMGRRSLGFCIARGKAIYPEINVPEMAARWLHMRATARQEVSKELTASIIFAASLIFEDGNHGGSRYDALDIGLLLRDYFIGLTGKKAISAFFIRQYPKIVQFVDSLTGPFDKRMAAFERIAGEVAKANPGMADVCLAFFCNEILPGSLSYLNIVRGLSTRFPSVVFWYALFCGCSAEFNWRLSIDGAGAKLARDIFARFDIESRPTCDISIEELDVLSRISLKAAVLKSIQQRVMLVSLLPGVEVYVRVPGDDVKAVQELHRSNRDDDRLQHLLKIASDALGEARASLEPEGAGTGAKRQRRSR
jgi:hypothetical protein